MRRLRRSRSVILGYHGVTRSPPWLDLSRLQVSPARFRTHVELLLEAGFQFVTVAELAHLAAGGTPPPGYAALSFDDGMRNNYTVALPILQEHGIRATVYVSIDLIGGTSPWIDPRSDQRMLDAQELRTLAAAGWELGGHTVSHPDLSRLDYDACRHEIEAGRTALEQIAGVRVETFAYPFGRYGPAALQAVRDSGLIAAVTTGSGSWDPYELTRAMIGAADPMPVVLLKLSDSYEPLLRFPPLASLRSASKRLRGRLQEQRQRTAA
jgi:peptidoglycan/xylan/chitin deacetylase (PgdA/CDA1 family)